MSRILQVAALALILTGIPQLSHASLIVYTASLSGPAESPPNASPGTGFAEVDFDLAAHFMRVRVTFSGLTGPTSASHIHSATATPGTGTAGVATQVPTFTGFPLGVTSGTYDHTFDTSLDSFYNPAFETANGGTAASAEAALAAGIASGRAYLNIHTGTFPGGEIRGFLVPAAIPEPPTHALVFVALGVLGWAARRRTVDA